VNVAQFQEAARRLFEAHERRERFVPLPKGLGPQTPEEAYAIQDEFVALRAQKLGGIAGYKIALSSPEMQRFVGVDQPQAGCMLESTLRPSEATVRASDYGRLLVEFEIAFRLAEDLPAADAPYSRERVAQAVGEAMAAIEVADDRNADYAQLARHPLELIADNSWNEGAVLGEPVRDWKSIDLCAVRGVATINGEKAGEGVGAAAMGHPLDSLAWVANHLAKHHRGLLRGDVVITGSLITSKFVKAGDRIAFEVDQLGKAELQVTA
jgi:2-keto-4-pentenoate hydratase